jgi:hypothetical protein
MLITYLGRKYITLYLLFYAHINKQTNKKNEKIYHDNSTLYLLLLMDILKRGWI